MHAGPQTDKRTAAQHQKPPEHPGPRARAPRETDNYCGEEQAEFGGSVASSPESLQGTASRQYTIVISPRSGKQGGGMVSLMQSGIEFRSVDFEGTKNRGDGQPEFARGGVGMKSTAHLSPGGSKMDKASRLAAPAVPKLQLEHNLGTGSPRQIHSGKLVGWPPSFRRR